MLTEAYEIGLKKREAEVADLQRRLRDAEAALAASYKSEGKWISLMGEAKAERGEMRLERDAALAKLREAEEDLALQRKVSAALAKSGAPMAAALLESDRKLDAARAALRKLAEALKSALDEYVPKSDGKRWPGPRLSILNDRLRYEAALADPVVQAVLEGKADG